MRKRKVHRLKEHKKKEVSVERIEKIQEEDNKAEYQDIIKTFAEGQTHKKI